jgi:hypothetical protein
MTTKPTTATEVVLVRQYARRAVVAEIKRQGYRIASYEASEITALAKDYLAKPRHPFKALAEARAPIPLRGPQSYPQLGKIMTRPGVIVGALVQ